jgi:hypothetical protein
MFWKNQKPSKSSITRKKKKKSFSGNLFSVSGNLFSENVKS